MSPEICKAESYTLYSDIWALGCIVYELCAREPPFNAKTHLDLIQKIRLGRYPPIPAVYSAELNKVIASCLQVVPGHRPDTAQLLNLPAVKLMRKEQEVVVLGQGLKDEKARAAHMMKEAERKLAEVENLRKELDSSLRREWEVRAQLEIDRQVKLRVDSELAKLQEQFESAVNARVEKALAKYPNRLSTSPRLAPRSSTPTMPSEQSDLFPLGLNGPSVMTTSASTLGTESSFASGTDLSSLSLEDTTIEEPTQKPQSAPAPAPAPTKRSSRRAPLARAQTMFTAQVAPPSPMDIQMAEPSPAPASIAGLSLSPRRNASRQNIFAAAKDGSKKWEADIPPSPTEEEWNGAFDEDDDLPVLPSPTRARSASGGRHGTQDPFKALNTANRPLLKPTQRLASAPSLAPNGVKPRPASAVPIVATSPSRQKTKSIDITSPTRKTTTTASKPGEAGGLRSKKGHLDQMRVQAMRNNGIQGRTLVELQQARGIPVQAMSEDEGKRGLKAGLRSPVKGRSANEPAVWDPEIESDMPSPFIVRSKRMVK
jgi:NIMA (never in mitosis gene a)-related kinase 2